MQFGNYSLITVFLADFLALKCFCWQKRTNYAELVRLCVTCPIMHKIMRVHNRLIPLSVLLMLSASRYDDEFC